MKPDLTTPIPRGQRTLPGSAEALHEDDEAINIANQAVIEWNGSRKAEITSNNLIQDEAVQSAMADEIFAAFLTYLKTIPSGVQEKVITKFHTINLPKKVITL